MQKCGKKSNTVALCLLYIEKKNTKDALFDAIGSADMNSVVYCFPCCIGLLCYILVLFSVRVHNSFRSVRIKSQCSISKKTSILRL